jgi:hypothetical protein
LISSPITLLRPAHAVADAVTSLLDDTEVRANARQFAKEYARHNALDTIERLRYSFACHCVPVTQVSKKV